MISDHSDTVLFSAAWEASAQSSALGVFRKILTRFQQAACHQMIGERGYRCLLATADVETNDQPNSPWVGRLWKLPGAILDANPHHIGLVGLLALVSGDGDRR